MRRAFRTGPKIARWIGCHATPPKRGESSRVSHATIVGKSAGLCPICPPGKKRAVLALPCCNSKYMSWIGKTESSTPLTHKSGAEGRLEDALIEERQARRVVDPLRGRRSAERRGKRLGQFKRILAARCARDPVRLECVMRGPAMVDRGGDAATMRMRELRRPVSAGARTDETNPPRVEPRFGRDPIEDAVPQLLAVLRAWDRRIAHARHVHRQDGEARRKIRLRPAIFLE